MDTPDDFPRYRAIDLSHHQTNSLWEELNSLVRKTDAWELDIPNLVRQIIDLHGYNYHPHQDQLALFYSAWHRQSQEYGEILREGIVKRIHEIVNEALSISDEQESAQNLRAVAEEMLAQKSLQPYTPRKEA